MADRHTLEELNNCSREELITIVLMMQGQLDTLNENLSLIHICQCGMEAGEFVRSVAGDDSTFIIFEKTTKNESTIDNS